jgi:hypothetical protein
MQMQHVGSGVFELRLRQRLGGPVGRLLLLGQIDLEQFLGHVLESVPVGVGAGQPRGDLGAEHRLRGHAEGIVEHGNVETAVVETACASSGL